MYHQLGKTKEEINGSGWKLALVTPTRTARLAINGADGVGVLRWPDRLRSAKKFPCGGNLVPGVGTLCRAAPVALSATWKCWPRTTSYALSGLRSGILRTMPLTGRRIRKAASCTVIAWFASPCACSKGFTSFLRPSGSGRDENATAGQCEVTMLWSRSQGAAPVHPQPSFTDPSKGLKRLDSNR